MSLVPAFEPEPAVSPSWARSCDPTIRAARSAGCWLRAKLQQWPWIRLPVFRKALSGAAKHATSESESDYRDVGGVTG